MSDYTVNELKDMARESGIRGFSKMKKAELIKVLKAEGVISKSKTPSPKEVITGVRKDFNKMVKADIATLIISIDPTYYLKSNLKKAELIEIAESLMKTVVAPAPLARVPTPPAAVVPGAAGINYEGMTVVQLKDYAQTQRGMKIGAMKKSEIIALLQGGSCDPTIGSYCSNPGEFCDVRYNTCTTGPDSKLEQILVDGHNIVGSKKALDELKARLALREVAPKRVSPVKMVSPKKKVTSPPTGAAIEDILSDITRPPVSTQEFRQNLDRLKVCLGLMSK